MVKLIHNLEIKLINDYNFINLATLSNLSLWDSHLLFKLIIYFINLLIQSTANDLILNASIIWSCRSLTICSTSSWCSTTTGSCGSTATSPFQCSTTLSSSASGSFSLSLSTGQLNFFADGLWKKWRWNFLPQDEVPFINPLVYTKNKNPQTSFNWLLLA